ncbi:hypothetical protein FXO37_09885 [Capsicum annuum]|nr:hypothetical protein FXO37_09885 [Capsicum annuum]
MNLIQPDPIQSDPLDLMALDKNPNLNYLKALAQTVPSISNPLSNPNFYNTTTKEDMYRDELVNNDPKHDSTIMLIDEDKARIHRPWAYYVIIKLTRLRVNHAYPEKSIVCTVETHGRVNTHRSGT